MRKTELTTYLTPDCLPPPRHVQSQMPKDKNIYPNTPASYNPPNFQRDQGGLPPNPYHIKAGPPFNKPPEHLHRSNSRFSEGQRHPQGAQREGQPQRRLHQVG